MATDAPKSDDPYGGFNDFDHAYDLGVSCYWSKLKSAKI